MDIKKLLLIIFYCIPCTIQCSKQPKEQEVQSNIDKSFFYGSIGAGSFSDINFFPFPGIGLGYRYQHNHIGIDFSADLCTLLIANMFRLSPAILFYPYPNDSSEGYCGLSCGCLYINLFKIYRPGTINYLFFLPELVSGYQYKMSSGREGIIEFRLGIPIILEHNNDYHNYETYRKYNSLYPCASIKFGFSF